MFGRRPDATRVPNLSPMRRIMPHISPRRNESVFYYAQQMEVEAALEFLEKRNRERPDDRPITLFHLLLRSISQMLVLRPGVNRFVKGGRLWQHDAARITFSAKRELRDGSPLLTIKRRFEPESESLDEMVDGIYAKLRPARAGVESTSDKETKGLVRLPPFLVRGLIAAANGLDALGLLPRFMIEPDPLYTSVFVANVGSVDLDGGFHHLWERGTCSSFCVMGRIESGPDGRRFMKVYWTYDERIEDGLYAAGSINACGSRLEQPELLLARPSELAAR
jgi:pyruvate/2-oxoglutarate dehydrogenase complex dihydrolipoamide acyltransferase (E2) component